LKKTDRALTSSKKFYETIQKAGQALSPSNPPSWSSLEVGIAKYKATAQAAPTTDFFKFRDNTSVILIAQPMVTGLELLFIPLTSGA